MGNQRRPRVVSHAVLDFRPYTLIDFLLSARSGRVLSRVGVESWLHDPDANRPRGTVALPTSMKGVRMDNFSVRSERNFHNLKAKPRRMHLLDKPSGYASAMVKHASPDRTPPIWAVFSQRPRQRKARPSLDAQNGMHFPDGGPGGKRVPESRLRAGQAFRLSPSAETASRNKHSNWDALSKRPASGKRIPF